MGVSLQGVVGDATFCPTLPVPLYGTDKAVGEVATVGLGVLSGALPLASADPELVLSFVLLSFQTLIFCLGKASSALRLRFGALLWRLGRAIEEVAGRGNAGGGPSPPIELRTAFKN